VTTASVTAVVATRDRPEELREAVRRLAQTQEVARVVVVDNSSLGGPPEDLTELGAAVEVVALPRNLGAAGRNVGAAIADTELVAFCDDDSWFERGALSRAVARLASHPEAAAVAARVVVEPEGVTDPTCEGMARSPLGTFPDGCRVVLGFLACGAVVRRQVFLAVGGFEAAFGVGGEETPLCLDLATAGWSVIYAPDVVAHHHPSSLRDARARRRVTVRNALWSAWTRRPPGPALRSTFAILCQGGRDGATWQGIADALVGLPWALRTRAPVDAFVEGELELLEE
jgi:N-acetylglucosaminyl-diphospho-decaprenol L-rhamnosyltransferase